jgi:hypothetical protein
LMFPDTDILERRLEQIRRLPWPIPAVMVLEITDEDLDALDGAGDSDEWWRTLNRIIMRIKRETEGVA